MTTKKAAPTDDELLAQFEDLSTNTSSAPPSKSSKPPTARAPPKQPATTEADADLFADISKVQSQRPSRPSTPSVRASGTPKRSTATPPPGGRSSEEKSATATTGARKSGESTRSLHQALTPATTDDSPEPEPKPAASSGGGWWGGLLSTATAAVSQAQAAVKEIQKNEEAQKWASQVRGNVGALRGFGGDLSALALPALQNLMHTIAPPISSHERLQIHITHDLTNYPTLDPIIYTVFSRVMSQVEGGDLMVVQRGHESSPRRSSPEGALASQSSGGWNDGPWWRDQSAKRSLNAIRGEVEGSKLARASAESYSTEYFASRGGVEGATKQAAESLSESNPVRDSDIFLALQAIVQPSNPSLFKPGPTADKDTSFIQDPKDKLEDENRFAIYLHDPVHGIAFSTLTQSVPGRWIEWLDASSEDGALPESISEIIESGGVDPREWVAEWLEEAITLGVGIVAQRYVARRMGVGEGGVGKGKMKAEKSVGDMIESGGGEAARAVGGV